MTETRTPETTPIPESYEPRDPAFYVTAAGLIAASLLPPQIVAQSDHDHAEKTGHLCARFLDKGMVPRDYAMPKTQRILELVRQAEILDAANLGRPIPGAQYPVVMNEGERQRQRAQLDAAARENGGTIPTREAVMEENRRTIAAFADVSDPIRWNALLWSQARISSRPQTTGARPEEALGIVLEEMERAIRFGSMAGLPVRSIEKAGPGENASLHVPYPGNIAVELMQASAEQQMAELQKALGGGTDPEAPEAAAAPTPAAGSPAPAQAPTAAAPAIGTSATGGP